MAGEKSTMHQRSFVVSYYDISASMFYFLHFTLDVRKRHPAKPIIQRRTNERNPWRNAAMRNAPANQAYDLRTTVSDAHSLPSCAISIFYDAEFLSPPFFFFFVAATEKKSKEQVWKSLDVSWTCHKWQKNSFGGFTLLDIGWSGKRTLLKDSRHPVSAGYG